MRKNTKVVWRGRVWKVKSPVRGMKSLVLARCKDGEGDVLFRPYRMVAPAREVRRMTPSKRKVA